MVHDYGVDVGALGQTFLATQDTPFDLVTVPEEHAARLSESLAIPVRRSYISDAALTARQAATAKTRRELVAAKLPDPGSTMAGDFGEILTALFQAAREHPSEVVDPMKLRLKQDRTQPAPKSDVVQFIFASWPEPSSQDRLLCCEVKTKSIDGPSTPIPSAIDDSKKDSDGRLAKTLVWLRERALDTGLETTSVDQLDRFIKAIEHPSATREFRAVAVLCSSIQEVEVADIDTEAARERRLVVIAVPDLKSNYEAAFRAALESVEAEE